VASVVCLLAPLAMADDGIVATQRTPPREQLQRERRPRIGLVIGLWQCDKENHGWREGLPLTVAAKSRSEDRPSPSGKDSLERKKNTAFHRRPPSA
jgi:hypothetical protein